VRAATRAAAAGRGERRRASRAGLVALLALAAAAAAAEEAATWLRPESYRPTARARVAVAVRAGGSPAPIAAGAPLVVVGAGVEHPAEHAAGAASASVILPGAGTWWLAHGAAKALVRVGPPTGGPAERLLVTRPLGLPVEIVPAASPHALALGDALPLLVLRGGAPLAGARVAAGVVGAGVAPAMRPRAVARTDAAGRAEVRLDVEGTWLVTAATASLTFDLDRAADQALAREHPERLFRGVPFPTRPLAPGGRAR